MNIEEFIKDRDDALLSLDRDKIEAYMEKYGVPSRASFGLNPQDDIQFWAAVHKARTAITNFPSEEKKKSIDWLKARGFTSLGGH